MVISELKSVKRSLVMAVLGPCVLQLFLFTGLWIRDHYKIRELEKYKVDKEYFDQTWYRYQLLIESKTILLENISSNNVIDIAELKKDVVDIRENNGKIMLEIAKLNRVRGSTSQ